MDLSNPLRTIAPGVEGEVLAVLLRSRVPLTGARVAALSARSETQVRVVLRRLEQHGLVDVERHGQSYSYLLNRDHVLVPGLELLRDAMPAVEAQARAAVASWTVPPAALVLFGSAARRDGGAASDLDLLLVRPGDVDADDEVWADQRHALARDLERSAGNAVQVLELTSSELAEAARRRQPLVRELRADGIVLAGHDPTLQGIEANDGEGTPRPRRGPHARRRPSVARDR
ncbi:MAG: nucleotidyltransferase domain-containing protein [Acidimicrobiia bacterium]